MGHYESGGERLYATLERKLSLLDTIIRENWIEPDETWKLQSLGISFGDALVQELKMEWVTVQDEYGRDPAIRDPGTTILLFPLTTISKRIERAEKVDVRQLFKDACQTVNRLRAQLPPNNSH